MPMSHRTFRFLLAAMFVAMLPALAGAQVKGLSDLVLVGNSTGMTQVTDAQLRTIFRGERSIWPSGEPVVVVLPSARAEWGEVFAGSVLGTSRVGMQRYWLSLVFQGRAGAPLFGSSAEDILEQVIKTPGAIGMIPSITRTIPQELLIPVVRRP